MHWSGPQKCGLLCLTRQARSHRGAQLLPTTAPLEVGSYFCLTHYSLGPNPVFRGAHSSGDYGCGVAGFPSEEMLHMAAAAEASSEHPLAKAVLSYARSCLAVSSSSLDLTRDRMLEEPTTPCKALFHVNWQ